MASPARVLPTILLALAMTIAGCASAPLPGGAFLSAVPFAVSAPDARTVSVAGSFNRWDPNSHPLAGPDRSGRWAATLRLPPGRYEYQYVINGEAWVPDPAAPSVDNGLGGQNSIITVSGGQEGER